MPDLIVPFTASADAEVIKAADFDPGATEPDDAAGEPA